MKKIVSILLTFLILYANTGWALVFHYCKEELASVSLEVLGTSDDNNVCIAEESCCDFEEGNHKKCCENQQVEPSDLDENFISKSLKISTLCFPFTEQNLYDFTIEFISNLKKRISAFYTEINAPPLYQLYCQLVFYA